MKTYQPKTTRNFTEDYIGSAYDTIKEVHDNLSEIRTIAEAMGYVVDAMFYRFEVQPNQTIFSGNDLVGRNFVVLSANYIVFLNGKPLDKSLYSLGLNGTQLTVTAPLTAGDQIAVSSFDFAEDGSIIYRGGMSDAELQQLLGDTVAAKNAAETAKTAAASSQALAATQATNAANSATAADTHKKTAETHKNAAAASATAADAAKVAAQTAQTGAEAARNALQTLKTTTATLLPGAAATTSYAPETNTLAFGIPRGLDGEGAGSGGTNLGVITPSDYSAVGDGVTDDTVALQNLIDALGHPTSRAGAYNDTAPRVVDLEGRSYLISSPLKIALIGGVSRRIHSVQFQNGRLIADPNGAWTGDASTGVPNRYMILVCDESAEFVKETNIGLYRVGFVNVQLRCKFATGGILFRNTDSCYLEKFRVEEVGKGCEGIRTGGETNGALMVNDAFVQGFEETSGLTYPSPETQDTMGTTAIWLETNDARVNNFICCKVTKSIHVDNAGAIQFDNCHPWAKLVYLGPNAKRMMFSNCYFDYTTIHCDGSFNHFFEGCHLLLGGTERWLRLTAHQANETGSTFRWSGYINATTGGILHDTSGAGTWADQKDRTYTLDIQTEDYGWTNVEVPWRSGKFAWIENTGKAHFQNTDATKGRTSITGNNMFLGVGRSTDGYGSVVINSKIDDSDGLLLEAFAAGYVTLGSKLGNTELLAGGESYLTLSKTEQLVRAKKPVHVDQVDTALGEGQYGSSVMALGASRTADGYTGISLISGVNSTKKTLLETYGATGNFVLNTGGEFNLDVKGGRYLKSDSTRSALVSVANFEAPSINVTNGIIAGDALTVVNVDVTKGEGVFNSNTVTLGDNRTVDGLAGVYLQYDNLGLATKLETFATGKFTVDAQNDITLAINGGQYLKTDLARSRLVSVAHFEATNASFMNTVTVPTPTEDGHAATKAYVDANAGGGGGSSGEKFTATNPDATKGVGTYASNIATLGGSRTTDGLAGLYLQYDNAGLQTKMETFSTGNFTLDTQGDMTFAINGGQYLKTDKARATLVSVANFEAPHIKLTGTINTTGFDGGDMDMVNVNSITTNGAATFGAYLTVAAGGQFAGNLWMQNYKITGLGTPTSSTDAATKAYVDANAGGGVPSVGAVGSYAFLYHTSGTAISAGSSYSGSSLGYSGFHGTAPGQTAIISTGGSQSAPSGTWRAMGRTGSSGASSSVFVRIS